VGGDSDGRKNLAAQAKNVKECFRTGGGGGEKRRKKAVSEEGPEKKGGQGGGDQTQAGGEERGPVRGPSTKRGGGDRLVKPSVKGKRISGERDVGPGDKKGGGPPTAKPLTEKNRKGGGCHTQDGGVGSTPGTRDRVVTPGKDSSCHKGGPWPKKNLELTVRREKSRGAKLAQGDPRGNSEIRVLRRWFANSKGAESRRAMKGEGGWTVRGKKWRTGDLGGKQKFGVITTWGGGETSGEM